MTSRRVGSLPTVANLARESYLHGIHRPGKGAFVVTVDPGTPPTSLELDSLQRVRAGRIDPSNQQFTNTIHTGPSTPVTRVQLAKRDPVAGTDIVCVSGSVTGAKCSIAVVGHDGMATGAGGTTSGLTRRPSQCFGISTRAFRPSVLPWTI